MLKTEQHNALMCAIEKNVFKNVENEYIINK